MIKQLIKLANHLDTKGLRREAGRLDLIIEKMAGRGPGRPWDPGKKWREHNLGAEEHTGKVRNVEIDEDILRQIRENSFIGTIETDPAYGMYHFDGHRKCDFSCSPEKTKELGGECPVCSRGLTVGVDYRVEELAGGAENKGKKKYPTLLPLHEVISLAIGKGMNTKSCWTIYDELIERFENEFNILLNVGKQELTEVVDNNLLVDLIMRNRVGDIKVKPGYDGTYGKAILEGKIEKQGKLF